jgi:hypothetical protein
VRILNLLRTLFPRRYRPLPGKRWINIGLRTVHLVGVAGIGGAYLLGVAAQGWLGYLLLTIASGLAMIAVEVWSEWVWVVQVRGVAILAKLALLVAMAVFPRAAAPLFMLVIVISALASHAPARIRHRALFDIEWDDTGSARRRHRT